MTASNRITYLVTVVNQKSINLLALYYYRAEIPRREVQNELLSGKNVFSNVPSYILFTIKLSKLKGNRGLLKNLAGDPYPDH